MADEQKHKSEPLTEADYQQSIEQRVAEEEESLKAQGYKLIKEEAKAETYFHDGMSISEFFAAYKYAKEQLETQGLPDSSEKLGEMAKEFFKKSLDADTENALNEFITGLGELIGFIAEVSDKVGKAASSLAPAFQYANRLGQYVAEINAISPYITEELQKPIYKGKSLEEVLVSSFEDDENGLHLKENSLYERLIKNAQKSLDANKRKQRKKIAEEQGAIITLGDYLMFPSNKGYEHAFTTVRDGNAYIIPLAENHKIEEFIGRGKKLDLGKIDSLPQEDLGKLDTVLLTRFFKAVFDDSKYHDENNSFANNGKDGKLKVYLPSFLEEMGIYYRVGDDTENKMADIFGKIDVLKRCFGVIGNAIYAVLLTESFNAETQTLTFSSPYMRALKNAADAASIKTVKDKQISESHYNELVMPTIGNERNKIAVDIVLEITSGILRRGARPDTKTQKGKLKQYDSLDEKTVSYHIAGDTLIENIPALKEKLDNEADPSNRNKVYQQALKKAFELIYSKTIVSTNYNGFKIVWQTGEKLNFWDSNNAALQKGSKLPTVAKASDTVFYFIHEGISTDNQPK